jgi:hypothetical protein
MTDITNEIGTHSLKSTPLAWAAMFGLSITDRELLGHHSLGNHRSALTYSRDAQARPLQLYSKILRAIAEGHFDPDTTRSGRFYVKRRRTENNPESEVREGDSDLTDGFVDVTAVVTSEPEKDTEQENEIEFKDLKEDQVSQSSTSDSSDSDDSVQSLDETRRDAATIRTKLEELDDACTVFFHLRSSVVHYRDKDSVNRLKCGRIQNLAYAKIRTPFEQVSLKFTLLCKQCFGA